MAGVRNDQWHEILITRRKDSGTVGMQHNPKMLLAEDPDEAAEECQSQVDWNGVIWPSATVLAVFLLHPKRKIFGVVLPPEMGPSVFTHYEDNLLKGETQG